GPGANKHKVCHVQPGNKEHKYDSTEQHRERRPNARTDFRLKRKADVRVRFGVEAVRLWHSFLAIALDKRSQLSLSLPRRNAWQQTAQQVIIVAAAVARIRGIQS